MTASRVALKDGAELAVHVDGQGPDLLLVSGLGGTAAFWDPVVACLSARFRVIRFDHRDTGLSAKMHGMRAHGSVYRRIWRYLLGRTSPVPYTLIDMTGDVVALLEAGAIVLPAIPSFYSRPKSVTEVVDTVVWRVLDQIGLPSSKAFRWQSEKSSPSPA